MELLTISLPIKKIRKFIKFLVVSSYLTHVCFNYVENKEYLFSEKKNIIIKAWIQVQG